MSDANDPRAHVLRLVLEQARGTTDGDGSPRWLRALCRAAVPLVPVSGAGVIVSGDLGMLAVGAASDEEAHALERRQVELGEGPAVEAVRTQSAVLEPDLSVAAATRRWPVFAAAARESGIAAVFAFPLQVGAARLGTIDLYRRQAGVLAGPQLAIALSLADVAVEVLLEQQDRAGEDGTAAELQGMLDHDAVVHQAQGMVMVDLAVGIQDAASLLRAFAFGRGESLTEVSRQIVDGSLRLHRDGDRDGPGR